MVRNANRLNYNIKVLKLDNFCFSCNTDVKIKPMNDHNFLLTRRDIPKISKKKKKNTQMFISFLFIFHIRIH